MRCSVKIQKLQHSMDLPLPAYATSGSAGLDLIAAISEPLTLASGKVAIIPTGICIALPEGYEAQIRPRSGLAAKNGITVLNSPGTIDSDYRGEIKAILINHGDENFVIERGMRIAQMVISQYTHCIFTEVDSLDDTARGTSGFGSTGHK